MSLLRSISRYPRATLLIAMLLGVAGAAASARLDLKTGFAELLPDDDPGVVTLRATQKRMGDLSLLLVGVRSPDPAANERYSEALTTHLRALPPTTCELATYHLREIYDLLRANRWLYLSEDDLTELRDRLRKEVAHPLHPPRRAADHHGLAGCGHRPGAAAGAPLPFGPHRHLLTAVVVLPTVLRWRADRSDPRPAPVGTSEST